MPSSFTYSTQWAYRNEAGLYLTSAPTHEPALWGLLQYAYLLDAKPEPIVGAHVVCIHCTEDRLEVAG